MNIYIKDIDFNNEILEYNLKIDIFKKYENKNTLILKLNDINTDINIYKRKDSIRIKRLKDMIILDKNIITVSEIYVEYLGKIPFKFKLIDYIIKDNYIKINYIMYDMEDILIHNKQINIEWS